MNTMNNRAGWLLPTTIGVFIVLATTLASVAQQPQTLAATVVVWHNFGDEQEGSKLIQAGVDKTNPALLRPLVSCIAHEGAGYIVTEGKYYGWSEIIIVDGDQAGCRGTILTR